MANKFVVWFNEAVGYYNFSEYHSFVRRHSHKTLDYDCYPDIEQAVLACQRNNKRIAKTSTQAKISRS